VKEAGGYRIVAKRLYRDGSSELVTEPRSLEIGVTPCTAFEAKLLDMVARGEKPSDPRFGYKLAVACIRSRCFEKRSCEECFFRDVCAFPKSPRWFIEKGMISKEEAETRLKKR